MSDKKTDPNGASEAELQQQANARNMGDAEAEMAEVREMKVRIEELEGEIRILLLPKDAADTKNAILDSLLPEFFPGQWVLLGLMASIAGTLLFIFRRRRWL